MDFEQKTIFASLLEIRNHAVRTGNPELLEDVTKAENVAMREIYGIDLVGKSLDYDQLWANKYPNFRAMDIGNGLQSTMH